MQVKIQLRIFFIFKLFEFPYYSTREDLSIDASSITNVRLILTKERGFQLFSTSQNSISIFFNSNFSVFMLYTREDISIDLSISY